MSRSTKKPIFTDQQKSRAGKLAKRQANRSVRDSKETPANGKAYRKESCSWNIRDWSFYDPKNPKAYRK